MTQINMMPTVAETVAANPGITFNLAPAELQTIDWYCDTVQFDSWYSAYTVDAIGEPDADGTVTIFCHADKMPAVCINDKYLPFTTYIVNGLKTVETRKRAMLRRLVGKRIGILRTGCGPAELVGFATIAEEIEYQEGDAPKDCRTALPCWNSPYSMNRYGYRLTDVRRIKPVVIGTDGYTGNRTYRMLDIESYDRS